LQNRFDRKFKPDLKLEGRQAVHDPGAPMRSIGGRIEKH